MAKNIIIINGPNLNLLGTREPEIYGKENLSDIKALCEAEGKKLGLEIDFRQSNSEGELVNWVQEGGKNFAGLIVNAAAYTHTSIAIMDALLAIKKPIIEVHLSNIFKREEFRHHSYVSPAAAGVICGFGSNSYVLAINAIKELIK